MWLSLAAYRLAGAVGIQGVYSIMVVATRGITAGSGFATDELHIIMYLIVKEAYLVDICPTLAVYVDDTSVYMADSFPTKAAIAGCAHH